MKTANIISIAVLAIVVLTLCVALPASCTVIPPGHRGISVTLGKVSKELGGEGLNWKKPFIETVHEFPIQQFTATEKTACFSSDLQTVEITYSVLYRIPENQVINLFQNYAGNKWDTLIAPRSREALKQAVSKYTAAEIVKQRDVVRGVLLESLRVALGDLIVVVDTPLVNIDLSDELEAAIEKKQVMEQTALAKTYELQRETKEAEITIVKAKAEAEAVKIKGEALKSSPDVILLEIAKKWDGKSPSTVVTSQGGANVLLPLK